MKKEERESQKRIERALKDPFKTVLLSEEELKKYVAIRNALLQVAELG